MVHKNNSRTRKYIGGSDSGKHVGKKSESNTVGKKIKGKKSKKSKKKGDVSLLNDSSASRSHSHSHSRSHSHSSSRSHSSSQSTNSTTSTTSSAGVGASTLGTAMKLMKSIEPNIHDKIMGYIDLAKVKTTNINTKNTYYLCKRFGSKKYTGLEGANGIDLIALRVIFGLHDMSTARKEIEKNAFINTICIIRVTIDNSVEVIQSKAFSNCSNIRSIKFGKRKKLRDIGYCAFMNCSKVEELDIPIGVEKIGAGAFLGCKNLKKVILPSTLRNLGYGGSWANRNPQFSAVFNNCTSLEEVIITSGDAFNAVRYKGTLSGNFDGCPKAMLKLPPIRVRTLAGDEYMIEGITFLADFKSIPPENIPNIKSIFMEQHGSKFGGKSTFKLMGSLRGEDDFKQSLDGARNNKKFFQGLMEYEFIVVYNPKRERSKKK